MPREPWLSNLPLANRLSPAILDDFSGYLASIEPARAKRHPAFSAMHTVYWINQKIARRLARGLKGDDRNPQNQKKVHWRYQYPLEEHLWGFHWEQQEFVTVTR